jgi:hypothetical protein
LIKEKDKSIANPNNLKGSKINQTIGYKIKANKASGQHNTIKINQRRKLIIIFFLRISAIGMPDWKSIRTDKQALFGKF